MQLMCFPSFVSVLCTTIKLQHDSTAMKTILSPASTSKMLPNSETFEILIKQLILEGDVQSIVALLVRRCRCRCCLEVVRGTREVEVTCVFFFRILLLRGCMVVFSLLPGTRHAQVWFYGTQQYNEPVVG
jgi:hypothetical protein